MIAKSMKFTASCSLLYCVIMTKKSIIRIKTTGQIPEIWGILMLDKIFIEIIISFMYDICEVILWI